MVRLTPTVRMRAKKTHRVRAALSAVVFILSVSFCAQAQTVTFNAPFASVSQTSVTYGQGIVADANSNLYITGTVNLLFLQRNSNGTYTPASTKIDSMGGTAYGLAIDAANNLYRPDIAPGSNPYLAKYIYQSVNTFTKAPIGTWTTANSPSSVAVDADYNVYVLDAGGSSVTTGSLIELTPAGSCSSNIPACTTYTQTTLLTDTRLHSTTGLSRDSAGNFYVSSGSSTGDTPTRLSNSTEAVYKLIPSSGTYSLNTLSSGWTSPAATAIDSLGNVWVADYGAQKIYQLVPQSSSPAETNYTKVQFQSATSFTCLRTLTVSKTGQLFGLETGGSGCNSTAVPEVGGTAPHNLGTPQLGTPSTQEVDVSFPAPQPTVNYSLVTQGSTSGGLNDATPSSGSTSGGTPYCTGGTSTGSSCAIIAQFTPAAPGLQLGAVLIKDSSGIVIGTDYLYAVGYGSEATLMPGGISIYTTSSLAAPVAEAVDVMANLYVADTVSNVVVQVTPGGSLSTLAGTGSPSTSSDPGCGGGGLATSTNVTPTGVALDGAGTLYFSDLNEDRVCALNLSTGVLSTVAGTGAACSSPTAACGDGGAATSSQLALGSFSGLSVDELGNLLIADSGDNRIRSVNLNTGVITTVAGSGTACPTSTASCGDGGQATASAAYLNYPTAIAVNTAGDYLIADMNDNRIRKISQLTGNLTTVAGNGTPGSSGDGAAATAAELNAPTGLATDAAGDIYIADQGNSLIRMVAGGNGVMMTVAGGGASAPPSNPIAATNASLQSAAGIAVDTQGNLYVADTGDGFVDKVNSSAVQLTFPTATTVGTTDNTDGPLSASLMNIGNVTLAHASPAFIAPVDFQQVTGNSTDCTSTFSLGVGLSCSVRVQFVPQTIGSLSESFTIADNSLNGNPSTQTIALVGTGASLAPTISLSPSGGTLPAGTVGVAYSQSFVASGGTSPYTYSITGGSLPTGLTLSSGGVLSGALTSAGGAFNFTITATDSSSGPSTGHASYVLTINQGTATVSLGSLAQTYTGSPLAATATTSPAGLTVNFTYNGSATAPTAAGSYAVAATINDANYQGTATGTLVIGKATATVSLGNLAQTYTGSPLAATATTSPTGLTVSFTYNGSATAPAAAGSYAVVATINDANYQGTATGTLVIGKEKANVQWVTPASIPYGMPLTVTQLDATSNVAGSFTYYPALGTVLGGGPNQILSVTFTPSDTVNLSPTTQTVGITVNQAGAAASLSSNDNPSLAQTAVIFSVTLSSTVGTPTGSVTFLDGTTPLAASTLSGGAATLTVSSLAMGTHSITAVYSGDANFLGTTSATLSQSVIDFGVTAGGGGSGGGGGGNSGTPTQTITPGGTATYDIAIAPTAGSTFPTATLLTVTGLPKGATATLATAGWTGVTSTSWSLPARASLQDVSLSIHVPGASANVSSPKPPGNRNRIHPLTLALFLLPFARGLRRVRPQLNRVTGLLIALACVAVSSIALSGCGALNGFLGQQQAAYNVTVTITTGALSHSTYLTLNVE